MKKYVLGIVSVLCASMLLTGCAETEEKKAETEQIQKEETVQVQVSPMETEPVLDYEVPKMLPGAIVTQSGYQAGEEKRVVFRGKELPAIFQIIDANTSKSVYKGQIDSLEFQEETGMYTGYGDFSSFDTLGEYYIKCERIGMSYTFSISDVYYEEMMKEAVAKLNLTSEDDLLAGSERPSDEVLIEKCKTIAALAFSCELFSKMQTDGVIGEENGIPDVLEYAVTQAAYLASWQDSEDGSLGTATGWYCASLAKLSYVYQKYDSKDATRFLQASDRAWQYMQKKESDVSEEETFFAAAELYRATGKDRYHKVAKSLGKSLTPDMYNEPLTYGAITYFSTKQSVNKDICKKFMNDLMEKAEQIALVASKDPFFVTAKLIEEGELIFFQNMTVMVLVDYVITNEEYGSLIEDHQHYLLGRNELGVSFFDFESCESIAEENFDTSSVWLAKYIMMLSEILSRK